MKELCFFYNDMVYINKKIENLIYIYVFLVVFICMKYKVYFGYCK